MVEPTDVKLKVPPIQTGPLLPASAEKHGKLQSNVAAPAAIVVKFVSFTNCEGVVNGGKLLLLVLKFVTINL